MRVFLSTHKPQAVLLIQSLIYGFRFQHDPRKSLVIQSQEVNKPMTNRFKVIAQSVYLRLRELVVWF